MQVFRAHRRLVTLIAVFAILVGSLAPVVSRVLAGGGPTEMAEYCTADGTVMVMLDDRDGHDGHTGGSSSGGHPFEHCPYCSSHAPALDLPPVAMVVRLVPGLSDAPPPARLFAPRTLHAWLTAQPRAPPHA